MGDKVKDQRGNEVEVNAAAYPDDAPVNTGDSTPPSGQGGATPHNGVSYQDMFSPNPEPSESAAAKGKENDETATGDTNPVKPAQKSKK